mmetsp:Transcript_45373/g.82898  ORF Transcript_45373/g.82898 Transcript_45373/m.82898 type:complete len:389 (+) Transcript_45373:86-1252(+)
MALRLLLGGHASRQLSCFRHGWRSFAAANAHSISMMSQPSKMCTGVATSVALGLVMSVTTGPSAVHAEEAAKVADAQTGAQRKARVALVQMTAVNDKDKNFAACSERVKEAKALGCDMVCFPECFSFIGARPGEAQKAAEDVAGPTIQRYCALAAEHGLWLSLGGFQEKGPTDDKQGRIYNTHLIISAEGEVQATYRKIHLFDVPMTGLVESSQALPGSSLVSCSSPAGVLGVTVCYDLRFPELYQKLTFLHGATVLLVPSAFAMKTGEAHWETLLRSRAIETQCYVLAAAQVGQHNEDGNKRKSWGHSLAVDPWGKILADLGGTEPGMAVIEIDEELVANTRRNMPMAAHRRYDLYGGPPFAMEDESAVAEARKAVEAEKKQGAFFG